MIYLLGRLDDADTVDQALEILKDNSLTDIVCLHEFSIENNVKKHPDIEWRPAGLNYFAALRMALGKEETAIVFSPHLVCAGLDAKQFQHDALSSLRGGGTCVAYLSNLSDHINVAIGCRPQSMKIGESVVDKYFIQQYLVSINRCHARGLTMAGFETPNLRPLERYVVVHDRRMVELLDKNTN